MSIQQAKRSIENALKHLELPKQDIYKAIADARVELVNALEALRQGKEVSGCMHQWDAGYTCKRCHKKYNEAGLDLLNCKPPARERVCRQCGKRFDYDAPETREPSTLRSFWASYCPEHRVMRSEKELDSKPERKPHNLTARNNGYVCSDCEKFFFSPNPVTSCEGKK